jgi:hypothetical protein
MSAVACVGSMSAVASAARATAASDGARMLVCVTRLQFVGGGGLLRAAWAAPAAPLARAVAHVSGEFSAMARRADGEPILRARLRLGLPVPADDVLLFDDDDAPGREGGDWPLTLEIVDVDDRSRWCTAEDAQRSTPVAQALVREARFMPMLQQQLSSAIDAIAPAWTLASKSWRSWKTSPIATYGCRWTRRTAGGAT